MDFQSFNVPPVVISTALIGCGAVSQILYATALAKLGKEALIHTVALVDPNPSETAKVGIKLPSAKHHRTLDEMLTEVIPELAIIAAPHNLHADLVEKCLRKGIHVLCEKPMATSTRDCQRMVLTAQQSGRLLAVGHFRRFFPSCQTMKAFIDERILGELKFFRFLEGETYSWPAQSASFFNKADAGGGVLIDAGAHTMDLLVWWLGEVADLDYEDDAMGGVEANCRMRLKMVNGTEGVVQLSRDWPLPNRYIIEFEKGWLAWTYDTVDKIEWGLNGSKQAMQSSILSILREKSSKFLGLWGPVPGFMDCFIAQLRNVIGAIKGEEDLRVTGKEAMKSVALIERCYETRQLLPMPWLTEKEISRAQQLGSV